MTARCSLLGCAICALLSLGVLRAETGPPSQPAQSPQRKLLQELASLHDKEPRHIGAMYVAARTAAGMGDFPAALLWLDRLEKVGLGDELDPDDFGAFSKTKEYRERAARFAQMAPPIGSAKQWAEPSCTGLLPEGTAWDAKRQELLISSGRKRTVFAISASGICRQIVPPADGGLLAVLGMTIDADTDSLWVASTAAPFMTPTPAAVPGSALLARIDLTKGRVIESFPLSGGGLLNDLSLTPDGSVYVTDSQAGRVYRLAKGAKNLVAILPAESLEGPNGIIAIDGGDLLVADFHGLSRIRNPSSPKPIVARLEAPGGLYLGGIDGLARRGEQMIGIQNLVGRSRVWSLQIAPKEDRVTQATVLLRGHRDLLNPTTGAIVDRQFLFVADTKLEQALPDGTLSKLPPGRKGHRILAVPLR